ncbi:RILP-like protein homolog isoform X2 [Topomyia yanbarensis]|uniref:RILP-like protein homolog isoform X2 n=1 Tax=Topomyia yanbarensis TaxID=2498891 RepID=UPI00273BDBF9|nr:RILP-like protein homolog isoform X2 [Topomyia yanbarensis]
MRDLSVRILNVRYLNYIMQLHSSFLQEMESIEEQWRSETRELQQLVSRLQNENRRLINEQNREASVIQSAEAASVENLTNNAFCMDCDSSKISTLKQKFDEQVDVVRSMECELHNKESEINNMSVQIDRLKCTIGDCRRRHKLSQNQIITMFEERADFLVQLQDQQHEIVKLRKQLGTAEKENEDLTDMVMDDTQPRFSTAELKEVLTERNELKIRVNDLEQELHHFKYVSSCSLDNISASNIMDLPVQGPLPYEPDDAPWKKQSESGIRKFFRKFFFDNNTDTAKFPHRSISSLTKMPVSSGPHSDIPI